MRAHMTMSVALRNIRAAIGRFAFSVAGVAVATLLLAFILALYRGWNDGLVTYIDNAPADVWVTPKGSESFFTPGFFSRSFLPMVQEQPGVISVDPIVYRPTKMRFEGEGHDVWVIGFGEDSAAGPSKVVSGSGRPGSGEIVIDRVLSKVSGAGIGDVVDIGGNEMEVVGLSSGGNVVFAQLAFISEADAIAQLRQLVEAAGTAGEQFIPESAVSMALVTTEEGREEEAAAAIFDKVPGVNSFVSDEFASSSRQALRQSMSPVLLVVLMLAFGVGTLVVGLTVYTSVLEKEREFGVIKAIGTPWLGLLRPVLEQALLCCLFGFALGIAGAFAAAALVEWVIPQFITSFRVTDIAMVFGGAVAMSVLASIIPATRIMRVDTLSVFRA
jgi:putative ABC transport system permease protein